MLIGWGRSRPWLCHDAILRAGDAGAFNVTGGGAIISIIISRITMECVDYVVQNVYIKCSYHSGIVKKRLFKRGPFYKTPVSLDTTGKVCFNKY